ncbi:ABC transporter permease [Dyella sp. 20L07]|uniref:ABC transporter permease n=1 Tax=Dyella sp. 20L07 TaxID=3384240 RepID=UPI003D272EDA
MLRYYLDLALRSLRRSPVQTMLMVLAIGLGIGASMTMLTVLHVMTGDPMPGRSGELFYPHIDPLPLDYQKSEYGPDPSENFTWPDAMALLQAHRAKQQAAMAGGHVLVRPGTADAKPFHADGRYTTNEFFPMFGLAFRHGHGWSQIDDDAKARVVVLSEALSMRLFGSVDSVGRMVRMDDADLRVIGVTSDWRPQPVFYDEVSNKAYGDADGFFVPLSTSMDLHFDTSNNESSWASYSGDKKSPNLSWLQFWVRLEGPDQVRAYHQFLVDYSAQQKALGRFERPASNAALYGLMAWMNHQKLVPAEVRLQLWLAMGFLLVCMVNIVALLLAKFLRRSAEISVRRALGARRRDIFMQLGMESAMLGLAGGILGLLLAQLGLWSVRQRPDDYAHLAQMDVRMLIGTFVLAVVASLMAGLLPAWRACRIPPALQLKTL